MMNSSSSNSSLTDLIRQRAKEGISSDQAPKSADELRKMLRRENQEEKAPIVVLPPEKTTAEIRQELRQELMREHNVQPYRHGKPWFEDEYSLLLAAVDQGTTMARVGEILGRSVGGLRAKLRNEMTDEDLEKVDQFMVSLLIHRKNQ